MKHWKQPELSAAEVRDAIIAEVGMMADARTPEMRAAYNAALAREGKIDSPAGPKKPDIEDGADFWIFCLRQLTYVSARDEAKLRKLRIDQLRLVEELLHRQAVTRVSRVNTTREGTTMKVKEITYGMLRVKAQYENDRVEVRVELAEGDSVVDAVHEAKAICAAALMEGTKVAKETTFDEALDSARSRLAKKRARV